jgi:predicted ester cyclase
MTIEDNKTLIRNFLQKTNAERKTQVEMCVPGAMFHIGATPTMDLRAFRDFQTAYYAAFSETVATIEEMVAEGDVVAFRLVTRAVHTGAFMGTPASGNHIAVPVIGMARVAGGKIAEWWNSPDRLSWMQQIGAIPAPGQANK